MKTKLLVSLILILAGCAAVAETISIDIPAKDWPRVQEAFGGTKTEVQNAIKNFIVRTTHDYESRTKATPLSMQSPSPTPTETPTKK